ncbi:MAG: hypothetical protein U9Q83_05435 [Bacteroidota bacterium]|nr:hypothetical protein [Bacteroidota bacterium]
MNLIYTNSDNGIDFLLGLYTNIAIGYDITEKIGVQLGARYDYIPEDLSTDFADIELSGLSAEFKIIYSF